MSKAVVDSFLLVAALALPLQVWAQADGRDPRGASADGNYWFEVEVTVFSSAYGATPRSEVPVPSPLHYLQPLRLLQQQGDSYRFPFTADGSDPFALPDGEAAASQAEGPEYSPADPAAFKILDHERDPFMALDRRYWRFSQLNSRLQSNGEHAVLWHQVWRQPLRPRGQSPALQVEGGNRYGLHHQLEGSVRLSGQNDQPSIEANLWLSSFATDRTVVRGEWALPDVPVLADTSRSSTSEEAAKDAVWYPHDIWQLNQSRELGPNALHYLDHPALGMLVEIRPYLVPEQLVPATEPPRQPARTGFE